jgi:hypothetical protein
MKMEKIVKEYRGIAVEPSYWDLERRGLEPEQLVIAARDMNCNAIRVGFFGHTGLAYFQSKLAPHAPGLGDRDMYVEFKSACDSHGITLVPYVNTHFDLEYYRRHPEAISLPGGMDGFVSGTPLVKMCLNNPEYRQYTFSVSAELVERYQPDILYIDSLKLEHLCECYWCRKSFAEYSGGLPVPRQAAWGTREWSLYMEWYQQRYLDISKMCADNIRRVAPEIELISNRESFFNQITSTPEFNSSLANGIFSSIHAEAALRLYRETYSHITQQCYFGQAMNTDIWLWAEYVAGRWIYRSCDPAEMTLKLAKIISGGARPNLWTLTDTSGEQSHCASAAIKRVYGMMKRHPDAFDYTGRFAEVAQLYSTHSRQYYVKGLEPFSWPYAPDKLAKRYQMEFEGMFRTTLFSHQLSTFILDGDLTTENLRNYKTLLLPNCGCISDDRCKAIRQYVRSGGSLLATGETSLYDDNGIRLDNFKLADVFGCDFVAEGPTLGDLDNQFAVGGYLCPLPETSINFPDGNIPVAGRSFEVRPVAGIAAANFLFPGWYHVTSNLARKNVPGVICNRYGQGNVLYLPFEFGYGFSATELPVMVDFFGKCLQYLQNGNCTVETNLPATCNIFIRRAASGGFVIHLLNLPDDRPFINTVIPPVTEISLRLNHPELAAVKNVQAISGNNEKVMFETDGKTLQLRIAELKDYIVLVAR